MELITTATSSVMSTRGLQEDKLRTAEELVPDANVLVQKMCPHSRTFVDTTGPLGGECFQGLCFPTWESSVSCSSSWCQMPSIRIQSSPRASVPSNLPRGPFHNHLGVSLKSSSHVFTAPFQQFRALHTVRGPCTYGCVHCSLYAMVYRRK